MSYHMKSHIESLCEYDNFYGGVVLLGDDSLNTIVGWGKVRLKLNDGRIGTLLGVFHIPYFP